MSIDDEREATATAIRLSLRFDLGWSPDEARTLGAVLAEPVATRLAGFRRSEAPELSTGELDRTLDSLLAGRCEGSVFAGTMQSKASEPPRIGCNICGEALPDGETHICPEPQGEPSDAPTIQLMARKGGKTQGLVDQMLAQANEYGIRVEVVDQTIPMYAMLDVWMALYGHDNSQAFDGFYESAGYAEAWATLLAAIRARAGEPQGEPSDAQVLAALDAFYQGESSSLSEFGAMSVKGMRAALRAAGVPDER